MFAWRKIAVRRRVLVNLEDGTAIRGILWQQAGPLLELRHAELVNAAGESRPVDGAIVVERSKVSFVQVPEV